MESSEMENQEEIEERDAIAYVLVVFSEIEETKGILSSLSEVHGDAVARERTTERFHGEAAVTRVPERLPHIWQVSIAFFGDVNSFSVHSTRVVIMYKYLEQPHLLDPHLGMCHNNKHHCSVVLTDVEQCALVNSYSFVRMDVEHDDGDCAGWEVPTFTCPFGLQDSLHHL